MGYGLERGGGLILAPGVYWETVGLQYLPHVLVSYQIGNPLAVEAQKGIIAVGHSLSCCGLNRPTPTWNPSIPT